MFKDSDVPLKNEVNGPIEVPLGSRKAVTSEKSNHGPMHEHQPLKRSYVSMNRWWQVYSYRLGVEERRMELAPAIVFHSF